MKSLKLIKKIYNKMKSDKNGDRKGWRSREIMRNEREGDREIRRNERERVTERK